jgi:hypothetical protein
MKIAKKKGVIGNLSIWLLKNRITSIAAASNPPNPCNKFIIGVEKFQYINLNMNFSPITINKNFNDLSRRLPKLLMSVISQNSKRKQKAVVIAM